MSEAKFTKGSWSVGHANFERTPVVVSRRAGRPATIATVNSGIREEDEANARLMSAAPDLYDLALNVGGTDERLLVSADLRVLRETLREFIDQARAALAKARGEQ